MAHNAPANRKQDWKSTLALLAHSTDANLKSVRRANPEAHIRAANTDADTRATKLELNGLLAAVQGSLAELRSEVATAKRLSNTAHAAAAANSIGAIGVPARPATAPRSRGAQAQGAEPMTPAPAPFMSPPRPPTRAMTPMQSPGGYAGDHALDPAPSHGSQQHQINPDELVHVLDVKMDEMSRRLEMQISRSLTMTGHSTSSKAQEKAPATSTSDNLVLLGVTRSEAAERSAQQLTHQVSAMEKQYGKGLEDLDRRVSELQESNKQHWEKICNVLSQVDAMQMHYKTSVDALPAMEQLHRLETRVSSAESTQARSSSELEEQQRLLLALTTAVQKAGQEMDQMRSGKGRQDELTRQLEASVARIAEVETRVAGLNNAVLASKARELTIGLNTVEATQPSDEAQRLQALESELKVLTAANVTRQQESALVLALESKLVSMECTLQSLSTASQQHATDLQHGLAAATTQLQQDTAAQLQDVLARTAETERVMRDMQAAQDALTHKVQAMQQGAEEVSKALTVVGDQLQKLVSKYAGPESNGEAKPKQASKSVAGMDGVRAQVARLADDVARLEHGLPAARAPQGSVTRQDTPETVQEDSVKQGAAALVSSDVEARLEQLSLRMTALENEMRAVKVTSAEELERSQRLMKTAEQSLSETHKTVIQAVAPIQALQGRVDALKSEIKECRTVAETAAEQAAGVAVVSAQLTRMQEQQRSLQQSVSDSRLQSSASVNNNSSTGAQDTKTTLSDVQNKVDGLQTRLDADWFVTLEQNQLHGPPVTHTLKGHTTAIKDLSTRVTESIGALRADLGRVEEAASAQRTAAAAAAVPAGTVQTVQTAQPAATATSRAIPAAAAVTADKAAASARASQAAAPKPAASEAETKVAAAAVPESASVAQGPASVDTQPQPVQPRPARISEYSAIADVAVTAAASAVAALAATPARSSSNSFSGTAPAAAAASALPSTPTVSAAQPATATVAATPAPAVTTAAAAAAAAAAPGPASASRIPSVVGSNVQSGAATATPVSKAIPAGPSRLPPAPTTATKGSSTGPPSSDVAAAGTVQQPEPVLTATTDVASKVDTHAQQEGEPASHFSDDSDMSDLDDLAPPPLPALQKEAAKVSTAGVQAAEDEPDSPSSAGSPVPPAEDASVQDKTNYYEALTAKQTHSAIKGMPQSPARPPAAQPAAARRSSGASSLARPSAGGSLVVSDRSGSLGNSLAEQLSADHLGMYRHSVDDLQTVERLLHNRDHTPTQDMDVAPHSPDATLQRTQPVEPLLTPAHTSYDNTNDPTHPNHPGTNHQRSFADSLDAVANDQSSPQSPTQTSSQGPIVGTEHATQAGGGRADATATASKGMASLAALPPLKGGVVAGGSLGALPPLTGAGGLGRKADVPPLPEKREPLSAAAAAAAAGPAGSRTSGGGANGVGGVGMGSGVPAGVRATEGGDSNESYEMDIPTDDEVGDVEVDDELDLPADYAAATTATSDEQKGAAARVSHSMGMSSGSEDLNAMSAEATKLADMLSTPPATTSTKDTHPPTTQTNANSTLSTLGALPPLKGVAVPSQPATAAAEPRGSVGQMQGAGQVASTMQGGHVHGSLDFHEDSDNATSPASSTGGSRVLHRQGSELSSAPSMNMDYANSPAGSRGARAGAGGGGLATAMSRNPLAMSDSDEDVLEVFNRPTNTTNKTVANGSHTGTQNGSLTQARTDTPATGATGVSAPEAASAPAKGPGSYQLTVVTGGKVGAGIRETLHVTLRGDKGEGTLVVENPGSDGVLRFQRSGVDVVRLEADQDLGQISEIHVWHTGQGFSESWNVERIEVKHLVSGHVTEFVINDWVRGGKMSGRTYRPGVRVPGPLSRESSVGSADLPFVPLPRMSDGSTGAASAAGGDAGLVTPPPALLGQRSMTQSSGGIGRHTGPPPAQLPTTRTPHTGRAGVGDLSLSLSLDTSDGGFQDDDSDTDLPIFGLSGLSDKKDSTPVSKAGGLPPIKTAHGESQSDDKHQSGSIGPGVILDEDIEDVSTTIGPGWGSSGSNHNQGGASGAGEREGAELSAPRLSAGAGTQAAGVGTPRAAAGAAGRPPLPPTPTQASRAGGSALKPSNSTQLTAAALGLLESGSLDGSQGLTRSNSEISLPDSGGGYVPSGMMGARARSGRKVRTSGLEDDDRASVDSWDTGGELSVDRSHASLTAYAPGGVRPPVTEGTSIGFLGTSRKRVSFSEYSEQFELPVSPPDSDTDSPTGDQEAVSYNSLLEGKAPAGSKGKTTPGSKAATASTATASDSTGASKAGSSNKGHASEGAFEDVPLGRRAPNAADQAMACRIKIFTADKMNAGLGSSTVHLEILGTSWVISQALPKERGAFQRGCVDRFAVSTQSGAFVGELGEVLAIKIWHERASGKGRRSLLPESRWCLQQVYIENRISGVRYVFANPEKDGWLPAGKRHALVLKPQYEKLNPLQDLRLVQQQVEDDLKAAVQDEERKTIAQKLRHVARVIASLGSSS